MKIRKANPLDAKAIAKIHIDSWRSTYQNTLTAEYLSNIAPQERDDVWSDRLRNPKPNQHVVVAEIEGQVAGFVCVFSGENPELGSYLDNLHVRNQHQSNGIGKLLVAEAARWCFKEDPKKGMCLLVDQANVRAQNFYIYLGARNVQKSKWTAPDGSVVPTYWFVWDRLIDLI